MDKQQLITSLKHHKFPKKVIDAFQKVSREKFVSEDVRDMSYKDTALPIGEGQTISQPYTIALMLSEMKLNRGQSVLEIGSGSGYVLALISELVGPKGNVFGVERIPTLAERSEQALKQYENIKIYNKSGADGLEEESPFDRILISAAIKDIPERILDQLSTKNGILVAPKGSRFEQDIVVIERRSQSEIELKKQIPGFVFVPFVHDEESDEES